MGDSTDVVRTSRQHISYHFNLMHMNYKKTLKTPLCVTYSF